MRPPFQIVRLDGRAHAGTATGTPVPGAPAHRWACVVGDPARSNGAVMRVQCPRPKWIHGCDSVRGGDRPPPVGFATVARSPALLAVLLVVFVAACAATPAASFDPSGPCTQDGS